MKQPQIPVQPASQPTQNFTSKKYSPTWSLVIGLVLIFILIGGGYFLGQKSILKAPTATQDTVKSIPTKTLSFDPIANWQTFTTQSGISFKYPSDWTPKEKITPKDSSGYGPVEGVTISSPKGIIVSYSDSISGLGGGCDLNDCPYNHILKVEPVNISGFGTLDLVELVIKDSNDASVIYAETGLIDPNTYPNLKVGVEKRFASGLFFQDKDPKKYLDQFSIHIYDSNSKSNRIGQLSNLNQYFTDPEVQTAEKIIKTLNFTGQTSQINESLSPTQAADQFPTWKIFADSKYNFSFKYPTDWSTQVKDYPENNQRLINIIKNSSPSVISLSFTIANGWDRGQFGNAQEQPKNYSVGDVPAYRMDPPTKTEQRLERYQTNVYFEAPDGHVFVFICTHNWDQNYLDTCNNLLSTFKFTN